MYAIRDAYLPTFLQKVVYEPDPEHLTCKITYYWSTEDFMVFKDYNDAMDFATIFDSSECCIEIWELID